jgi:hypothetical protein
MLEHLFWVVEFKLVFEFLFVFLFKKKKTSLSLFLFLCAAQLSKVWLRPFYSVAGPPLLPRVAARSGLRPSAAHLRARRPQPLRGGSRPSSPALRRIRARLGSDPDVRAVSLSPRARTPGALPRSYIAPPPRTVPPPSPKPSRRAPTGPPQTLVAPPP